MALLTNIDIKLREKLNPYLAPFRRKRLLCMNGAVASPFTIISNNCWGGHVYRYFGMKYFSPTVGMYFFAEDYLKFLKNLEYYLSLDVQFIPVSKSKHYEEIKRNHIGSLNSPIGVLDDIEIVFLHCKTEEEAYIKWSRRKNRVNMDNLIVKMSESNSCSLELLKEFDKLPFETKFVFTTKDYGLKSQVIFKEYSNDNEVRNDTSKFRKYINLENLINGLPFKKNQ